MAIGNAIIILDFASPFLFLLALAYHFGFGQAFTFSRTGAATGSSFTMPLWHHIVRRIENSFSITGMSKRAAHHRRDSRLDVNEIRNISRVAANSISRTDLLETPVLANSKVRRKMKWTVTRSFDPYNTVERQAFKRIAPDRSDDR